MLNRIMKVYDVILDVLLFFLIVFTGFVICYYTMPEKTSAVIAKALNFCNDEKIAKICMDYINGFTIGAGFPLIFSQKAIVARYLVQRQNKYATMGTQALLAENLKLQEIQVEFQKAEALRFQNSPTMPAKARLGYKNFLQKLEERDAAFESLKEKTGIIKKKKERKQNKHKVVKPVKQTKQTNREDALI